MPHSQFQILIEIPSNPRHHLLNYCKKRVKHKYIQIPHRDRLREQKYP